MESDIRQCFDESGDEKQRLQDKMESFPRSYVFGNISYTVDDGQHSLRGHAVGEYDDEESCDRDHGCDSLLGTGIRVFDAAYQVADEKNI